ncbi:hypothetical protein Trichorick_01382 (plasmid) [Candidatus Trichorickettsia mobilis]|uniref:Uncharacterized protein n=1 Tax=Candidatus Trichorickettsia mobilis TaxID=1346319 RepID=A0ABZ0UZE5_9RICK|nr:hypothetical protein [Candidatus Trichorickettsia mobilis]WPY01469.1 hypothetical protein Trichorick_01382 [Candidatus Trichorickettsia mobilis]
MGIVKQIVELLKQVFLNRMFWIGMLICFAMFSKYILGSDNLVEQLGEKFTKDSFGIDVDFSPENNKQ